MYRKKETLSSRPKARSDNSAHIISYAKMMQKLNKMTDKGPVIKLQFDPLGYLRVNGEDQTEPADFLLFRKGTLYASINGIYHCAGMMDEHPRMVAIVQGLKFIAERGDGSYDYSSRKVSLPWHYALLVLFRNETSLNLLIADARICDHVRVITLDHNWENEFLLRTCFLSLLNHHDSRMASIAEDWYGNHAVSNSSR